MSPMWGFKNTKSLNYILCVYARQTNKKKIDNTNQKKETFQLKENKLPLNEWNHSLWKILSNTCRKFYPSIKNFTPIKVKNSIYLNEYHYSQLQTIE